MKKALFILCFLCAILGIAQIPNGYYDGTSGLTGEALKSALNDIIDGHTELTYSQCWDALKVTDQDPSNSNNVVGIYSRFSIDGPGEYAGGDGWNREHVWPQSRGDFGTSPGAGTDIHHLRACDVSTNSARSNKAFDDGGTQYIDASGTYSGPTPVFRDSDSWEPGDDQKGDIARMIFYMATRYEGESGEPDLELTESILGSSDKQPLHGRLSALLAWHEADPVDQEEVNRHEAIYDIQGNRNPFIDHPEWVDEIWGEGGGSPSPDIDVSESGTLDFGEVEAGQNSSSQSYTVSGSDLEGDITVTVSSPFQLSLNDASWSTSQTVTQANAESGGQTIYVRFSPTIQNSQTYNQTISHTSANAVPVNVSVTGTEYTLVIDDISTVRSGTDGQEFVVEGIVTTPDYGSTNGQYFIEDESGGINIFHAGNQGDVSYGDEVRIAGTRSTFSNLIQLEPSSVDVLSSGNSVPDPQVISEADISTSSSYLGQLVRIGGVTLDDALEWPTSASGSGTNVNATVGATNFIIRIDDASFYNGTTAPSSTLIATGILTRFNDDVQIMPFFEGDIEESAANPPDLSVGSSSVDFPNTTVDTQSTPISISIDGADLTEDVSVSATGEFYISTSEAGSFESSLLLSITDGAIDQDIYVQFSPTTEGEKIGTLVVSSSGEEREVDLSGTASPVIVPEPEIVLSRSSIDFGEVSFGDFAQSNYTVSGVNLTGSLVITPPDEVTISLSEAFDGTVYSLGSSLSLAPAGGTVVERTLYVRYTPSADDESTLSGNITHVSGEANEQISVSGNEEFVEPDPVVWVSEFHYDNVGQDQNEFVEIYIENASEVDLSQFTVELVEADGSVYSSFLASSMQTNSADYYFRNFGGLKDGPNGIRILYGTEMMDFIAYEGAITGATLLEVAEGEETSSQTSLQFCCLDESSSSMTWIQDALATPGMPNQQITLGLIEDQVWIYPNPIKDQVFLSSSLSSIRVRLTNLAGQSFVDATGSRENMESVLNQSIVSLEKGIYLLTIDHKGESETLRISISD